MVVVARPRSIPRILKVDFCIVRRVRRLLVGLVVAIEITLGPYGQMTLLRYTYIGVNFSAVDSQQH